MKMIVNDLLLVDPETAMISSARKQKIISNSQLASITVQSAFPEKQLSSSYTIHQNANSVDSSAATKYETQVKPITSVGRSTGTSMKQLSRIEKVS